MKLLSIFGTVDCLKEILSCQFNEKVRAVFYDSQMTNVVVQTDNELIHVVSAGTPNTWIKIEHKIDEGFICPYFVNSRVHYCYWNRLLKGVVFSHEGALLKSPASPKLLSYQVSPLVCLLTRDNSLVVADFESNITHTIPLHVKFITAVDYVTPYYDFQSHHKRVVHIFCWSNRSKCVARVELDNTAGKLVNELIYWSDPTKLVLPNMPDFPRFMLLPAVPITSTESLETLIQYVYAVLRMKQNEQL